MKRLSKLVLLLLCAPLLTGCGVESLTADTLPWVSDVPLLFVDDFSQQTAGWKVFEDRLSYVGYSQNGFRLWVDLPNYQVWSVPGLNFRDTHTYARVRKIDGPNDNLFGLLCRYQDEGNFYALVISSDGYYGIYKKEAGIQSLIGLNEMDFDEAIHRENGVNEILAVCEGDQLALFVNDTKLLQVTDDTFSYGDVGLIAGNLSEPGVDVLFDYFIVVKP